jgi:hypothetical protein
MSKEDNKQARELAEKDLFRNFAWTQQEMKKQGVPLDVAGFDEGTITFSTAASDQDNTLIVMTIGMPGDLTRQEAETAARAWLATHKRYPRATTWLQIAGYDDDPRELYEFPEVTRYVRRFARAANIDFDLATARLHPTSIAGAPIDE